MKFVSLRSMAEYYKGVVLVEMTSGVKQFAKALEVYSKMDGEERVLREPSAHVSHVSSGTNRVPCKSLGKFYRYNRRLF